MNEERSESLLGGILEGFDSVALEAVPAEDGGFEFHLLGDNAPAWFAGCFGSESELCDHSPFLEDFVLGHATDAWKNGTSADVKSGIWEEPGPRFFEARALHFDSASLLLISNAHEAHLREQLFNQHAHEEALNRRRLAKERERKEILLDCIVHDLASPLSTILMNVQHVRGRIESEPLRKALERAQTQAERQRDLIYSISNLFSTELGGLADIHAGQGVDAIEIVESLIEAHRTEADAKLLQFRVETEMDSVRVKGDREHFERVVDNLLLNAIQHSPPAGKVTVGIAPVEDANRIQIFVRDEGPGIPENRAEALFEPFSPESEGEAGLGLYFCKMVVELWGGSIAARSEPFGGSRIEIELPQIGENGNEKSKTDA
ncbi:MAG: HAMP domain-containing histidine kinase [Verrucomicrobiales bacterium]|nr:HAMP domain-containing histidine kinase [Verrucomicrobiales bacterium]